MKRKVKENMIHTLVPTQLKRKKWARVDHQLTANKKEKKETENCQTIDHDYNFLSFFLSVVSLKESG